MLSGVVHNSRYQYSYMHAAVQRKLIVLYIRVRIYLVLELVLNEHSYTDTKYFDRYEVKKWAGACGGTRYTSSSGTTTQNRNSMHL